MIEGAQLMARSQGYFLLSTLAPDEATFDNLIDQLVKSGRVDGLIIIQPFIEDHSHGVPDDCPTIFAGGGAHANQMVGGSVVLDDAAAAYEATNHLLTLDHTAIGMITGPLDEVCVQNRMLGYERALVANDVTVSPELIIEGDWSASSGDLIFRELWLNLDNRPTALFVQNDLMAIGVLHAAEELGLQIPDDLSIISIDDLPLTPYLNPPLTTMRQDFAELGRIATRMLIRSVEHHQAPQRHELIKATLIQRQSTGRPPPTKNTLHVVINPAARLADNKNARR
jgi:LacI family repressor for deo operon, udp, cdd, tsx, nupC, and nupG